MTITQPGTTGSPTSTETCSAVTTTITYTPSAAVVTSTVTVTPTASTTTSTVTATGTCAPQAPRPCPDLDNNFYLRVRQEGSIFLTRPITSADSTYVQLAYPGQPWTLGDGSTNPTGPYLLQYTGNRFNGNWLYMEAATSRLRLATREAADALVASGVAQWPRCTLGGPGGVLDCTVGDKNTFYSCYEVATGNQWVELQLPNYGRPTCSRLQNFVPVCSGEDAEV